MEEVQTFHPSSNFVPGTIADFLKELLSVPDPGDQASEIDVFVTRLQEELRKINGFKYELPLCVILMNEAIEYLKQAADGVNSSPVGEPILAEFIPLRRCREEDEGQELKTQEETDLKDKKNWMSSIHLWNRDHHQIRSSPQIPLLEPQCKKQEGMASMAFKETRNEIVASRKDSELQLMEEQSSSGSGPALVPFVRMVSCGRLISGSAQDAPSKSRNPVQPQLPRKQRRCWVPELHRQFVDALEKLGGPQAATPKQIRELMQVDGLTNDEVKSHLQKYRLHTRRLPTTKETYPSSRSAVLGDLWMNHEGKRSESSRVGDSQSGSPQGPFQLASNKSRISLTRGDSIEDDDENEKLGKVNM